MYESSLLLFGVRISGSSTLSNAVFQSFTATFVAPCSCAEVKIVSTGTQSVYIDEIEVDECLTCPTVTGLSEIPDCPSELTQCTAPSQATQPPSSWDLQQFPNDTTPPELPPGGLKINFQPTTMDVPVGYIADSGKSN